MFLRISLTFRRYPKSFIPSLWKWMQWDTEVNLKLHQTKITPLEVQIRAKSSIAVSKAGWNCNFYQFSLFHRLQTLALYRFSVRICCLPSGSNQTGLLDAGGRWSSRSGWKGDAVWFLPVTQGPEDWREAGPLQEQPGRWLPRDNDQVTSAEWTSHQANRLTLTRQRDAEMSHHSPSFFFPQVSPRNRWRKKKKLLNGKKKRCERSPESTWTDFLWVLLVNVGLFCVRFRRALPFFICDDTRTSSWDKPNQFNFVFFFQNVESWGHRLSLFWRLSRIRSERKGHDLTQPRAWKGQNLCAIWKRGSVIPACQYDFISSFSF